MGNRPLAEGKIAYHRRFANNRGVDPVMNKGAVVQGIGTLVVVGVGLIGGSFALSLKRAGKVKRVIGVGRTLDNLQRALELGVVDEISQDLATVAPQADLVLLSAPVGQMGALMAALAPVLPAHAIVTDAKAVPRAMSSRCSVSICRSIWRIAFRRIRLPGLTCLARPLPSMACMKTARSC
ncbi:prephenate dehydrogenase/arogenate dehydrogenase family protein [Paludibacterium denitrificans]|uniref:prephenate dehydrogenase/arogenate dehydrogenase family protein n=1 Tax=Paludibacterium denitrificans TaxID=2675226 RepID=UPI0028AAC46E|nr:prephenate dehydrogenase/arogenate dehydrogenase family protein [Paludibacterium denitrificans]